MILGQVFFSALIDAAGQALEIDAAYGILQDMRASSIEPGPIAYSAMMGVCSTVRSLIIMVKLFFACHTLSLLTNCLMIEQLKDWRRALDIYAEMKRANVIPTVSTLNSLANALCKLQICTLISGSV